MAQPSILSPAGLSVNRTERLRHVVMLCSLEALMQWVGRARQSISSNLLAPGGNFYGGNGKLKSELEIIGK